ncbi:hypothetical protein N9104_01700 [Pseudomonadales bacterium]|nr:hypothetical protein [Pseudomonadales bacterium]
MSKATAEMIMGALLDKEYDKVWFCPEDLARKINEQLGVEDKDCDTMLVYAHDTSYKNFHAIQGMVDRLAELEKATVENKTQIALLLGKLNRAEYQTECAENRIDELEKKVSEMADIRDVLLKVGHELGTPELADIISHSQDVIGSLNANRRHMSTIIEQQGMLEKKVRGLEDKFLPYRCFRLNSEK